ncbi:NUDIX domain-containing protein [Paenibacillus sp. GCM10027626]|uniref:NUDIX domain-containing protein n=1 Tax=Paenibacillus sp. GCM10027626 TaxID=3273411 RepID=UPI0036257499
MESNGRPIRNSAKAVIIHDHKVLLTKNEDRDGYFYLFPGGGQEKGEELKDAVVRECMEEVGCKVIVKDLLFVREYIAKNHQFAKWDGDLHQVEFYFECELDGEEIEASEWRSSNPDEDQVGVEWIELRQLDQIRLYPAGLVKALMNGDYSRRYVGDTN